MSTATGNYVQDNSSLANFKNWAQAISNAFSGFGWTQTADTGQVNWGSIASVPASTYVYEIWKAADALASSMPIYVKVEYGFSSTSPRIRMTVGTGSNGTGTINGQVCDNTPWQIDSTGVTNQGATTFPCYFSGSAGEFRMMMWAQNTPNTSTSVTQTFFFAIERAKDASGNDAVGYITVFHADNGATASNAANNGQQTLNTTAKGKFDGGIIGMALTTSSNSGTANGTTAAFPVFPIFGLIENPCLGLMTCADADVTDQSSCTVANMYGSTHTYKAFRGQNFSLVIGSRSSAGASMAILMRYE